MKYRIRRVSHTRFGSVCDCKEIIVKHSAAWAVGRGSRTVYFCSWQHAMNAINNINQGGQSWHDE